MHQILTLRALALVLVVLVTGATAMTFAGNRSKAQAAAAQAHVGAAAAAVRAWYQDPFGGHGSYRKLDAAALVREAPAISTKVHVTLLAGGRAYCLDDEEGGQSAYYVGGAVGRITNLNGATPFAVTLVHSATTTAAAVCANAS
jgi:hypothetical protein